MVIVYCFNLYIHIFAEMEVQQSLEDRQKAVLELLKSLPPKPKVVTSHGIYASDEDIKSDDCDTSTDIRLCTEEPNEHEIANGNKPSNNYQNMCQATTSTKTSREESSMMESIACGGDESMFVYDDEESNLNDNTSMNSSSKCREAACSQIDPITMDIESRILRFKSDVSRNDYRFRGKLSDMQRGLIKKVWLNLMCCVVSFLSLNFLLARTVKNLICALQDMRPIFDVSDCVR